jgi:hypothetical protein
MSNWKKPTEKQYKQVGWFFIAFAVLTACLLLPDASQSRSPILYILVIGGLFVGVPAAVGIGAVLGRLPRPK